MAGADVEMAANATTPGVKAGILVEFDNGMWWMMLHELSGPIVEKWRSGETLVSFVWNWHGTRQGSWQPDGKQSGINRYNNVFTTMQQQRPLNNTAPNAIATRRGHSDLRAPKRMMSLDSHGPNKLSFARCRLHVCTWSQ